MYRTPTILLRDVLIVFLYSKRYFLSSYTSSYVRCEAFAASSKSHEIVFKLTSVHDKKCFIFTKSIKMNNLYMSISCFLLV